MKKNGGANFFSDDKKKCKNAKIDGHFFSSLAWCPRAPGRYWEVLYASIMTRRAEALAFSRRVIPRTGKTESHIPPHKSGVLHDIFDYLAYF